MTTLTPTLAPHHAATAAAGALAKRLPLALAFVLLLVVAVLAGQSAQSLINAGMDPNLATFGAAVSKSEGNFGSVNPYGCVGAFQFCPGTFQNYSNGMSTSQFLASPQAQVQAWTKYEQDQNAIAQKNGLFSEVGQQVCAGGQCATVTDSSILYACQFGCGKGGKLYNLTHGSTCDSANVKDGNGVSVCTYLIKGAGYDVSSVTGHQSSTDPNKTTVPQDNGQQVTKADPSKTTQTNNGLPGTTPFQGSVDTGSMPNYTNAPQNLGPNGSLTAIGDPTICWVCDAVVHSMGIAEALVKTSAQVEVTDFWMIVPSLFMVALLWAMLKQVVVGQSPLRPVVPMLARFTLVSAVALAGATGTFGSAPTTPVSDVAGVTPSVQFNDGSSGSNGQMASASIATDLFLEPPFTLGAQVGADLGKAAASAVGMTAQASNCVFDQPSSAGVSLLADSATQLTNLACQVHQFASTGIQIGGLIITHPRKDSAFNDQMAALAIGAIGLFLMYMCFSAILTFGFALVECVLVSAFVATFLPVMIFAWAFESTRGMIRTAFDNMLFVFVYLAFSGIGGVVMVYVLLEAMQLGLGQTASLTSPANITQTFSQQFSGLDTSAPQSLAAVVRFAAFTVAGGLLSTRVIKASHVLAVEVSGFALAQTAGLAKAGPQMMHRLVNMAVGFAGAGVGVAGPLVGRAVGSIAGSVGGGARPALTSRSGPVGPRARPAR